MASRRITRTSTNTGLPPDLNKKNLRVTKGPEKNQPIKRTRSKIDLHPQPEQKKRSVFGDITNKNNKEKEPCKNLKKPTQIPTFKPKAKPTQASIIRSKIPRSSVPVKEEPLIIGLTKELNLTEKTKNSSSAKKQVEDPIEKDQTKPEEAIDFDAFDKEHADQPYWESEYAKDIFIYYKEQEPLFDVPDYMSKLQTDVTSEMRSILMDWLVEVQTNFELHHETLYLAAKLVDIYLSKICIQRSNLQLLGTAALFIACKFDERVLPQAEDFLYVCDDAYSMNKLFDMERKLFVTVGFHLGIPLSYRFLRRYCKVSNVGTKTMTLARYILELTLLDYQFCYQRESLKAAGCVWLALKMEHMEWNAMLTHHSGYTNEEAKKMGRMLNKMLLKPSFNSVNEVYNKYAHEVFLSVASIPKLTMEQLED